MMGLLRADGSTRVRGAADYFEQIEVTACTTPWAHAAEEYWSIRARPRRPIAVRKVESSARFFMVEVKAVTSPGAKINPFEACSTRSAVHPATLVATTGKPQAMASFTTKPQGSL